jgi:DNA-binding transcriptional ArsR family regulator
MVVRHTIQDRRSEQGSSHECCNAGRDVELHGLIRCNTPRSAALGSNFFWARLTASEAVLIVNHMVQFQPALDRSFSALSDLTRRAILLRLGRSEASVSELASGFDMTLTGLKKHVQVLEQAGLIATEKVGRVRTCRLGPRKLEDVSKWMNTYKNMLEEQLDHLEAFLERSKEEQ